MKNSVARLTASVIRMLEDEVSPQLRDAHATGQLRAATSILENIGVGAVWAQPACQPSKALRTAAAAAGLELPDGDIDLSGLVDAVFDGPPTMPEAAREALRRALLDAIREHLLAARALTAKPLMARLSGAPAG